MAIRVEQSATVVTGPDIPIYRLLTIRRALKLEIETGMKVSKAPLVKVLQTEGITQARQKRAAYADLDRHLTELGAESVPLR